MAFKHLTINTNDYYLGLPVNPPVYTEILDHIYRELSSITARYTRTIVVRLDLHPSDNLNPHSIDMTKFCKSFTRKLGNKSLLKKAWNDEFSKRPDLKERAKYTSKVAYCWVMEKGRNSYNKGIHWHLYVAVKNDDYIQPKKHAELIQNEILSSWETVAGKALRTHKSAWFYLERNKLTKNERLKQQQEIIKNPIRPEGVLISSEVILSRSNNKGISLGGVIDEAFYALTYLAKVNSKDRTLQTKGSRFYASSNIGIKAKDNEKRDIEIQNSFNEIEFNLRQKLDPIPVNEQYTTETGD